MSDYPEFSSKLTFVEDMSRRVRVLLANMTIISLGMEYSTDVTRGRQSVEQKFPKEYLRFEINI